MFALSPRPEHLSLSLFCATGNEQLNCWLTLYKSEADGLYKVLAYKPSQSTSAALWHTVQCDWSSATSAPLPFSFLPVSLKTLRALVFPGHCAGSATPKLPAPYLVRWMKSTNVEEANCCVWPGGSAGRAQGAACTMTHTHWRTGVASAPGDSLSAFHCRHVTHCRLPYLHKWNTTGSSFTTGSFHCIARTLGAWYSWHCYRAMVTASILSALAT